METLSERLQRRHDAVWRGRSPFLNRWRQLSESFAPMAGQFYTESKDAAGFKGYGSLLDNTGIRANITLGAGMMGGMTSPARPWFKLRTPDAELNKVHAVRLWLADCTRIIESIFQKSNTYRALHTGYEELGAFGTSVKVVDANFQSVIHHTPLTCGEYALATNALGRVDTMCRKSRRSIRDLAESFGPDALTPESRRALDLGQGDMEVTVHHIVEPNLDRDHTLPGPKGMAYRSVYWEEGAKDGKFLREGGTKRMRVLASRWKISGNAVYGESPGMIALGDARQLQHEQLKKAQAIDYKVKPPLQVPGSMRNKPIDFLPGGVTYYDASAAGQSIKSLYDVDLDLRDLREDIMDVRERIRAAFYADLFLMLANSSDTQKTATEIAERHEEKLVMLGPTIERLHNEDLSPLIDLAFDDALEAGLLPPPPQELVGIELGVEFVSILAQAQRAIATTGVDRYVMNMGVIAAIKPDVIDKFDSDFWADEYADMTGVDPRFIVASDKVAIIRAERAQQMAAAQRAQAAEQGASAVNKLANSPAPSSTNALGNVMDAFSGYSTPSGT